MAMEDGARKIQKLMGQPDWHIGSGKNKGDSASNPQKRTNTLRLFSDFHTHHAYTNK